jgi:predicted regulator of Ras-like GTPase activity (Roadblock/LC7/MglB family)
MILLPLSEILPRLNPALIQRRRVQRQIEVPTDISSPFDLRNGGLVFSVGPGKAEHATPPTAAPLSRQITPTPATPPPLSVPGRLNYAVGPAAPVEPEAEDAAAPDLSEIGDPISFKTPAPLKPAAPVPPPVHVKPAAPAPLRVPNGHAQSLPLGATPAPIAFKPVSAVPATPQPTPVIPSPVEPAPVEPMPFVQQPVAPPAKPTTHVDPLVVSLAPLAEAWPDAVRKELVDWNLVDTKVTLPGEAIELALKQGRIVFTWKTLRGWIKPPAPQRTSPADSVALELPLRVVAPLFLARQTDASKRHAKVAVDEDIPNLFFGFPQPENSPSPAAATARPSDTNFYVWDDSTESARVDVTAEKRGPSLGTQFVAKYATPNEVVSRAASLDGVAGALIALPDGLMVANQLPPDLNGDTLAAFLPQIFGKVSQSTKELRMGELNNLNFTVGNVPWKIYRVNSIFFAAFGRIGEPLPTAQLAALAGELDHKPK